MDMLERMAQRAEATDRIAATLREQGQGAALTLAMTLAEEFEPGPQTIPALAVSLLVEAREAR